MKYSRKTVSPNISKKLWVKAGGRCQYEGCNKLLYRDSLTEKDMNTAYIAHVVSASARGPRGDTERSPDLETDLDNIMLLCDECHRRIDREQSDLHSEERLLKMKKEHEERIELVTGIIPDKKSHVIIYTASIGTRQVNISYRQAANAMIPELFPISNRPIDLGITNGIEYDHSPEYWSQQLKQLEHTFNNKVLPLLAADPVQDFSIFGLAPQPLLIRLGSLLSDKYKVNVFQFHRNSSSWRWSDNAGIVDIKLTEPLDKSGIPVLVFSLSGSVDKHEVKSNFVGHCSLWEIAIEQPYFDFLQTKIILSKFREVTRNAFNKIKQAHSAEPLHIFPAMPVSAAIETGRLWMSKSDMPLIIYDKNTAAGGFAKALTISNTVSNVS